MKKYVALGAAATAASAFTILGAGMSAAQAAPADPIVQTAEFDLGDLDMSGTVQLDQFDPELGTLSSVTISTEVTMDLAACTTNRSEESVTVSSGSATGTAPLTFVGASTTAEASWTIPGTELPAFTGTDGCADWQEAGGDPASPPAGANSSLASTTKTDTWSATLTGADVAPYVGTGTVGFDYSASSNANIGQPSEWTIVFLAHGAGKATVTYNYDEEVGGITDETPDGDDPAGVDSEGLPNTGGPDAWLLYLGTGLVVVGAGLVMVRRPHSA